MRKHGGLPSELATDPGQGLELGLVVTGKADDEVAGPRFFV